MSVINKALSWIIKLIEVVLIGLGSSITVLTFINVVNRKFGIMTITWAEELSRYMFIWFSFLGIIIASIRGKNIGVDYIVSKIGPKKRLIIQNIGTIFMLFFLIVLFKGGSEILQYAARDVSPALRIPLNYIYICIPITAGLMIIIQLLELVKSIKSLSQ